MTENIDKLILRSQINSELNLLNKFKLEIDKLLISFDDGEPNHEVFNFENDYILQDPWHLGRRSGKFSMFDKFNYELQNMKLKLSKDFIDKWHEYINDGLPLEKEENQ